MRSGSVREVQDAKRALMGVGGIVSLCFVGCGWRKEGGRLEEVKKRSLSREVSKRR
jgi:hypothetical protein